MNRLTEKGKKYALLQIIIQLLITIISAGIFYVYMGEAVILSVLAGGLIAVVSNIVFALKAFQYAGARRAKQVVDSFYQGVKLKMLLTAVLFALSFKFLSITPLAFFATFSLTMVAPWLTAVVNKFNFNQQ
ncbi:ATP synthase subunit I [Thalassotalea aquiviva]|uniref:ATP synthase subunit I n=1 Tax=Thalassotalea aquiviva TaxID=3242415 RepID=UPI003529DB86